MKYLILFSVVFVFFSLQSCNCGIKECGSSMPIKVKLEGYTNSYDSIKVERFTKNGRFDNLIEEYVWPVIFQSNTDEMKFELHFRNHEKNYEHDSHDYRVTLLSDGNQFEITELNVNRESGEKQCGAFTKELMICPTSSIKVKGNRAQLREDKSILLSK